MDKVAVFLTLLLIGSSSFGATAIMRPTGAGTQTTAEWCTNDYTFWDEAVSDPTAGGGDFCGAADKVDSGDKTCVAVGPVPSDLATLTAISIKTYSRANTVGGATVSVIINSSTVGSGALAGGAIQWKTNTISSLSNTKSQMDTMTELCYTAPTMSNGDAAEDIDVAYLSITYTPTASNPPLKTKFIGKVRM